MTSQDIVTAKEKIKEAQDFRWKEEINPELRAALDEHIIDVEPVQEGNLEKRRSLGEPAFGAAGVEVHRCSLDIPKLAIRGGESVVIIGKNGAGKTTVFDAIMSLRDAHFDTKGGSGAVVYGKPSHSRERLRIARLNQEEILKSVGELTAGEVLEQTVDYFKKQFPVDWEAVDDYEKNLANQEAGQRIDELIAQVVEAFEMREFMARKVSQLSGGERTKLVLLSILASEPDVLLLDEPTNHLDMASIAKLTALFDKYKKSGVAVASISHVDPFLREAGQDGVVEVLREKGKREVRQSGAPYERYMKDRSRPRLDIGGKIEWKGREPQQSRIVISMPEKADIPDSPLQKLKMPSILSGEVVFLLGNNGTGKTKLLEAMRGSRIIPREKGVNIAYMPQFWPAEVAQGSVEDFFTWVKETTNPHSDVSVSLSSKRGEVSPQNRFIKELGERFGRSGGEGRSLLKKPLASFSGGEQRFLYLMAVSVQESVDVLLLDEPTNHMDQGLRALVLQAIRDFKGAVVIASHDEDLIKELAKDVGRGPIKPKTLVLRKEGDVSSIKEEKDPLLYIDGVKKDAARQARRIEI
ncbi:MAG: ATP-binding cassette domain-containing protein [Patescibacteria group bacterium]